MADDKLKTSPESPGQDRPGEMPAEAAPSMREPPAPETAEPEKVEEHTEPDQSVIPGMDVGKQLSVISKQCDLPDDILGDLISPRLFDQPGIVFPWG